MARRELIVSHPSQLKQLSRWPGFRPPGIGQVRIASESLPSERRTAWEKGLTKRLHTCGCDIAAAGLALGTVTGAAWAGVHFVRSGDIGWHQVQVALLIAFIGSVTGKAVGMWSAYQRLTRLIREIETEWKAPSLPEPEIAGCG
jgi:hypothetical protein